MDQEADKRDFQTCHFNVADDEQSYNKFVSQRKNKSETNDRIQFKIIHLKSKTNSEETFDATEKLRYLNKNNGSGTSKDNKKRVRTIFGWSYRDAKSSEQSGSGTRAQTRAKPKFLLRQQCQLRSTTATTTATTIFPKKELRRCSRRKKDIAQRRLN